MPCLESLAATNKDAQCGIGQIFQSMRKKLEKKKIVVTVQKVEDWTSALSFNRQGKVFGARVS